MHVHTLRSSKGRYPFRLGTTSFIYPAGWAENADRLADELDEVELLFFESRSPGSLPVGDEIEALAQIATHRDLTYTVHLPVDVDLCASDPADRRRAAETVGAICEATTRLPVTSYTLHLGYPAGAERTTMEIVAWRAWARDGLEALLATGIESRLLSIETLDYPFGWIFPLVKTLDLRVCLDIGHLILYGNSPVSLQRLCEILEHYLPWTTVIHLHGVAAGHDHRPLDRMDREWLKTVLKVLMQYHYAGSLSLEVFGLEEWRRSRVCFDETWETVQAAL